MHIIICTHGMEHQASFVVTMVTKIALFEPFGTNNEHSTEPDNERCLVLCAVCKIALFEPFGTNIEHSTEPDNGRCLVISMVSAVC